MSRWHDYSFTVGLPHMVPFKLSEVELLKQLGAFQWTSIVRTVNLAPSALTDELGRRLFASMVAVELHFTMEQGLDSFDEGVDLAVHNRIGVYGRRLVEGLFLLDRTPQSLTPLQELGGLDDLARLTVPWATMANAFVAHTPGDGGLAIATPIAFEEHGDKLPELDTVPAGIRAQMHAERTGFIEPFATWDPAAALPLNPRRERAIRYQIQPESDLNAANMLYCARYVAIMNYGERVLLTERLDPPLSRPLLAHLSTEHRRIYYFANASPTDSLRVTVETHVLPAPRATFVTRTHIPLRMLSRIDLARCSDGVLIASSLSQKALVVPGSQKSVLLEAERFLGRCVSGC